MAIYSFCGTPIQIEITHENAVIFNLIAEKFGPSPLDRTVKFDGRPEYIDIFNKVSAVINGMIDLNGGQLPYSEDDLFPLELVKVVRNEIGPIL